jgi:TPR repeat protein
MHAAGARFTVLALCAAAWTVAAAQAPKPDPKQDEKLAAELRARADKGDGDAALRLGNLLDLKRVAESRYGTALVWYRRGCELRDLSACHNVALAYQRGGYGLQPDLAEAARYYEKSAERGFINSMYNLAILYADGGLIATDPREGLKWMLLAQRAATQCPERRLCQIVSEDAKGYRVKLEQRLTSRERRETYDRALAWQPKP